MSTSASQRIKINLGAPKFREDPWTTFGEYRELGSVIPAKIPIFGKCWAATTYDAVNEVFKRDSDFVRDPTNAGRKGFVAWQWILPRSLLAVTSNMLGADGQRHRRLRSLVDQAFARRNIEGMEARLKVIISEHLDDCAEVARAQNDQFDLMDHFARPFPLTVICELLGLPLEDRPKFRKWFTPFSTVSSVFGIFKIGLSMRRVLKYLRAQIEDVRIKPRPGLLSDLVQVEHEGDRLTENELLSMVFLLLVAGHETTVHLISNMFLTLLEHPDQKRHLVNDWSLMEGAIEEVLRYTSPVQFGKPRYVAQDMEFYGQSLKRGEMIIPLVGSANSDPARFEDPNRFDIGRPRNYHMTFGSGPHVCLGMKLARVETRLATRAILERWPNLEAGFDLAHPDWLHRLGMRGIKTLPIKLNSNSADLPKPATKLPSVQSA